MGQPSVAINDERMVFGVRAPNLSGLIFGRECSHVIGIHSLIALAICPKILKFEILATGFVPISSGAFLVVIIESDVETHPVSVAQFVTGRWTLKHPLVETGLHLPTAGDGSALTENIPTGSVFPVDLISPRLASFGSSVLIPCGKPTLEVDVAVAADRIF